MATFLGSRTAGLGLLILLVLLGAWGLIQLKQQKQSIPQAIPAGEGGHQPSLPVPDPSKTGSKKGSRPPALFTESAANTLGDHFSSLSRAHPPEEARDLVEKLQADLSGLDPDLAANVVTNFIATGKDAAPPGPF